VPGVVHFGDAQPHPAPELRFDVLVREDLLGEGGLAHAPRARDGHHRHHRLAGQQLLHGGLRFRLDGVADDGGLVEERRRLAAVVDSGGGARWRLPQLIVGIELCEAEACHLLPDAIEPRVEVLDAPAHAHVVGEDWVTQAEEQRQEEARGIDLHHLPAAAAASCSCLLVVKLAQLQDVGGLVQGVLELAHPSLDHSIVDAPLLGVGHVGLQAAHVVPELLDLAGDAMASTMDTSSSAMSLISFIT